VSGKGFIYFFPKLGGRQTVQARDFEACGFGHALTGPGVESRGTTAGPDGLAGVLAVPSRPGAPMPRFDKSQIWRKGPLRKDRDDNEVFAYVGMSGDPAERPGPEDLAREHVCPGNEVTLLDGNAWVVPRCYAFLEDRPATLPRVLDVADDGETAVSRIAPAFQQLNADAFRFWMDFTNQSAEGERLNGAEQIRIATDAMAVNYRVGRLEIMAMLGLWGTVEFGRVLRAMVDGDACNEWLEKKMAETPSDAPQP
jgi:hypothetical protein